MSDYADMSGFQSDPWGPSASSWSMGGSSGLFAADLPSYVDTPSYVTAVDNSSTSTPWSMPSISGNDFLGGFQKAVDWGLKVSGSVIGANIAAKNQELQSYLAKSQFDIAKTKVLSDVELAKQNAVTNRYVAQARTAAALSGQNAVNFGTVGGSGAMFWLTVLGVVFAGIQVMKSGR